MKQEFQIGDTVTVKGLSHSARNPHMIVSDADPVLVATYWFNSRLEIQQATFRATQLEKVELQ